MLVCAVGDIHGKLDRFFQCVEQLEAEVGRRVDLVLQVGDFGVWPDATRLDRATKSHGDDGQFARLVASKTALPWPTFFIAGNHEDFEYLSSLRSPEISPNLHFLRWGETLEYQVGDETLRVGGIGGCFSEKDYPRESLSGAARRHYLSREVAAVARSRVDILLLHEPPVGQVTELHAPPGCKPRTWTLRGEGLGEAIKAARPRLCFTGHIHGRTERRLEGVRVVGLNIVARRGCALLFEIPADGGDCRDIAEYGGAPGDVPSPLAETVLVEDTMFDADIADPAVVEELLEVLMQWAEEVRGKGPLGRDARKTLHKELSSHEHCSVLMSALLGSNTQRLLEDKVEPGDRSRMLEESQSGALPDAARLARLLGRM